MSNTEVKSKKNYKRLLPIIAGVFLLTVSIVDANISDAVHFAKGSKVDGVDVSGMTYVQANAALESGINTMTIVQEGVGENTISTHFTYGNAVKLHSCLVFSHIDPRGWFGYNKSYKMGLLVSGGIDACSSELLAVVPPAENLVETTSAYIDYNTMTVVPEVQGNDINYTGIAKAIAEQRKNDPMKGNFALDRTAYFVKPSVVASDLEEECKWAAEHLTKGIDIEGPEGDVVHIGAAGMAIIVKYSGGKVKYSEEGAMAVADAFAADEIPDTLKVKTINGVKELPNEVLPISVDRKKSAESIIEAAKASVEGKEAVVAHVYTDATKSSALPDHIEVSTELQTLWIVRDGEAVFESPVVTGMKGVHDTPHGIFKVFYKQSPATLTGSNDDGSNYSSYVNYWMGFTSDIGLHDASWRSVFGGKLYIGDGSHGCVNCPNETIEKLYSEFSTGTLVIVY